MTSMEILIILLFTIASVVETANIIDKHLTDLRNGRLPGQRWNKQTGKWEDK